MLDIKTIRENLDQVKENTKNRKKEVDFDKLLKLDDQRKKLQQDFDQARSAQKKAKSKEEGSSLKEQVKKLEAEQKQVNQEFNELLGKVPNLSHPDVPVGPDESGNKVLRKNKEPQELGFKPKDHMELGESLGLIDTEKASKISGARFNYLFGDLVRLQFALLNYTFDTLGNQKLISKLAKQVGSPSDKPFLPVLPPAIVKADILKKMDRFDPIEDKYHIKEDDQVFAGSAEHAMGPLHMKETLSAEDLPIRYVGYSTAFRREAGTYGKDTNGILRRHQFDKIEIECFTAAENGESEQDLIVALQEHMMNELDLPYQVMAICTGDMGKPDYRQIDLETYMPGQGKYRETHTSDYMTNYQARRLNIKYKTKEGEKKFVHMNDATAFAMGRILIAIIENYQQKDGTINVPKVLQKYTNFKKIKK